MVSRSTLHHVVGNNEVIGVSDNHWHHVKRKRAIDKHITVVQF